MKPASSEIARPAEGLFLSAVIEPHGEGCRRFAGSGVAENFKRVDRRAHTPRAGDAATRASARPAVRIRHVADRHGAR